MVSDTLKTLKLLSRNYEEIISVAQKFAKWVTESLEECESNIIVESSLPHPQICVRKCMADDTGPDETIQMIEDKFRVNVHNSVMDVVVENLARHFENNSHLAADFFCLDPRNFPDINSSLSQSALSNLFALLIKCDSTITLSSLREELINFTSKWESLKKTLPKEYEMNDFNEGFEFDTLAAIDDVQVKAKCNSCENCAVCCYTILRKYNLFSSVYRSLYLAYKFVLTLSCTQVASERSFSMLKYVKTRLRNHLNQDHLEAFMLMAIERKILVNLKNKDIIDILAVKSKLLHDLLVK